jgi:hypothetical protein
MLDRPRPVPCASLSLSLTHVGIETETETETETNEGTYAGVLKKLGKLDEAETHYEMALSIDNKNPHILGKKKAHGTRDRFCRTNNKRG